MNVELVAQMFKNYQSNVLFHLEGLSLHLYRVRITDGVGQLRRTYENLSENSLILEFGINMRK